MQEAFIHQIFYSAQTRALLVPGFAGLDNTRNERPDWREYWPIRNFLRDTLLRENAFYAFVSPKFGAKTELDAPRLFDFIEKNGGASDVLLFSPFFDQMAYPINIFEQGAMQHPDTMPTFRDAVACIAPGVDLDALVMDSTNTVFCNFFAARPAFWRDWLEKCEHLFSIAEAGTTKLARRLNANTVYDGSGVPAKAFVIERVASLMLATGSQWKSRAFNAQDLPWSGSRLGQFRLEMTMLDALKVAYSKERHPQYLAAFRELRGIVSESLQQAQS